MRALKSLRLPAIAAAVVLALGYVVFFPLWAVAQVGFLGPVVTITNVNSTASLQIIGQNPSRRSIEICNVGATNGVWIAPGAFPGGAAPANMSAYEIPPVASNLSACYTLPTGAGGGAGTVASVGNSWFAQAATGTSIVSVFEF